MSAPVEAPAPGPPYPASGSRYDIVIAGGGAVGAALACALSDSGACVLLADPASGVAEPPAAFAPRPIALSHTSRQALGVLGVWDALESAATPIESIHVSERHRFGATRLEAAQCGVANFGSVVEAGALGAALHVALRRRRRLVHTVAGHVADVRADSDEVAFNAVPIASGSPLPLTATLLVVADGGRSGLREALGIDATVRDYRQCAIAAVVTARAPRPHTAFERFTPDGPVALLPMGGSRYGLVWTCGEARSERLAGLSGHDFARALAAEFGGRLGGFSTAVERGAFSLRLVRANTIVGERAVLIGNAANRLHPVAGQGFNLGMRDVACLAEVVAAARREGCDCGEPHVLDRYRRWRAPDHAAVARFTDALVDLFGHRCSPAALLRAPALVALDRAPPLKRALARRAMGLAGRVPRLALGLGLPP